VVYHIVFRTVEGFFLLKPDQQGALRRITAGILGRARRTFLGVRLHGAKFLSNHGHLALSGKAAQIAAFVGFVKRELSRRWGPRIGWRRLFQSGYFATAVITAASQRRCLKYVIAQSVKENLVERPDEWLGFDCTPALVGGGAIEGYWLDGTAYGRARQRAKRKKTPTVVRREDYQRPSHATFDPLPAMASLSPAQYRVEMAKLVQEIVDEAQQQRGGRPVAGVAAVLSADISQRSALPGQPWFEDRRRMIVWDDLRDPAVRAYLDRYWTFQHAFRAAADRWRDGEQDVLFPPAAFWPGRASPVPHPTRIAA
jgi:hypothetical protein